MSSTGKRNIDESQDSCKRSKPDFQGYIEKTMFTGDVEDWLGKSIISVKQFNRDAIDLALSVAKTMKDLVDENGGDERMKGKILGCVFYEPSTRTCSSFQAAMQRLGGSTIYVTESSSSVQKGETLADTIRCVATYCDAVTLRHPRKGSSFEAASAVSKPIMNAGDGPGEHPTQALLDLFTIVCELGSIEGKVITMVGDMKYGRTVHSLVRLLKFFEGVQLHYVSPENLRMPSYIKEDVAAAGVCQTEHSSYENILPQTDVLYVTRVQKERFENLDEYEACKNIYVINKEVLSKAKQDMIVMHPLPRVGEISEDIDDDPRSAYFRQMGYGMHMRMALLCLLLGKC
mmetsp:Transcript_4643/g.6384  ORF Transcript_4643/g.6384 Transcript_4643/m.6384 type:complete len:345 (+) Transcript_4643:90-1124(+)|eukprot:CAMPEP_0117756688 /NCGR_PEP_ID=MMETSP0947-20121206/14241_1 /TAXON_ID=44440 /ORGANISM="Chattonella subsalsa, Strain CCMP2191" /LENGTH=344 /DNA_ID=CAMNT_0005576351 /DNA_START=82 /DNA_END=1116 /DNA_ORIENTATION=-